MARPGSANAKTPQCSTLMGRSESPTNRKGILNPAEDALSITFLIRDSEVSDQLAPVLVPDLVRLHR
jgi:hypothetical protein